MPTATEHGTTTTAPASRAAHLPEPTRPAGLLRRNRDFRLLWIGETTGKYGAALSSVTLPLIAVTVLHASTLTVGLLSAATWLPWLLIGLPAGAWIDRLRHRPVMLTAEAASLLLWLALPITAVLGLLSTGYLLATALLAGTAAVFFQTAYTAYLPSLLPTDDRAEGNAKLHGSASAAQLGGSASGGAIAQAVGAANGMLVNAATFLVSLVCLSRIRHREAPAPTRSSSRGALRAEIAEGLRVLTGDRLLRSMTLFGGASNLALMGYQSILVVFLVREVGLGAGAVGGLFALAGIGGIAGAFAGRRVAARIGTARALLLFQLGFPALILLLPLTTPGLGLALFLIGTGAVGFGVVAGNTITATFRQQYLPRELLGRITSGAAFVNYGTMPLGAVLGGALGEAIGIRGALWVMTAGVPLAGLILLFSPVRKLRDLPSEPPEPAAERSARTARTVSWTPPAPVFPDQLRRLEAEAAWAAKRHWA